MAVPITATDAVFAAVAFFYGLAFIVQGMMGLGMGKPNGAGSVFLLVGIINGILGFMIVWAFLANPVYFAIGLLVLILAFWWLAAGIINIRGYDLMPLGNSGILCGLMMIGYAVFFASLGVKGVLTTIGGAALTVCAVSWIWAFWSVTLACMGKIKFPVVGLTYLIQAFYTLWIPAVLLLTGVVSLLPS